MIHKNKTKKITCYTELCCDSYCVHGVMYLSDIFESQVTGFSCFINFKNFLLVCKVFFFSFYLGQCRFFESMKKICQCSLLNCKLCILSSMRRHMTCGRLYVRAHTGSILVREATAHYSHLINTLHHSAPWDVRFEINNFRNTRKTDPDERILETQHKEERNSPTMSFTFNKLIN